jgi:multiple sugar transport system substrate-binding protein
LASQENIINSHYCNYIPLYRRIVIIAVLFTAILAATGCEGFNPVDLTPQPPATATADSNATPTDPPSPTLVRTTPASTNTPVPTPTSAVLVDPISLKGVNLSFWVPQFEDWMPGTASSVIQDLVDEFNRENEWGIKVHTNYFENYEDLYDVIQSAYQAEVPDLLMGYTFQSTLLDREIRPLVDLDFFINDPVWGLLEGEQDFYPPFWNGEVVEGKRYAIPFYRLAQVLYYNLTWGQELGFERPPGNIEQFQEQVCAAAAQVDEKPEGRGGWAVSTGAPSTLSWIYAFGGEIVQDSGLVYKFYNPQSLDAFTFVSGLHSQGCAWLDNDRPVGEIFAARNALVVSGSLVSIPFIRTAMIQVGNEDEWTVLAFPAIERYPGVVAYGPSLSILETTDEKELAGWLFIRWLVEPQNQARLVQVSGAFPTRSSALEHLADYGNNNPHWVESQKLLENIRSEPADPSWNIVRWVVSDAAAFLFSPFFDAAEVEHLLEELDLTVTELQYRRR